MARVMHYALESILVGCEKSGIKKRKFKKFRKGLHFFVSLENQRSDFLVSADQWPLICSCTTSATQKTTSLPDFLSQILDWFLNAFIKILLWKKSSFYLQKEFKMCIPAREKATFYTGTYWNNHETVHKNISNVKKIALQLSCLFYIQDHKIYFWL